MSIIYRENRYLLFLTENYAALEILKQYLQDRDSGHDQQLLSHHPGDATLKPWEMEPFVLFGSSFPRDKEYTQVIGHGHELSFSSMLLLFRCHL